MQGTVILDPRTKSAFTTYQGLYEKSLPLPIRMPLQYLMQKMLMELNPAAGADIVAVHLDDILVFSETFEAHLLHLNQVLEPSM